MNRIFFRIFPLIVLAIAAAAIVIYFAIRYAFGDPLEEIARRQAAGPIFLLEQYIDHAPPDEWLTRLNKVREISGLSMELISMQTVQAGLAADKREALERGDVVLDIGRKSFFRRVDLAGEKYVGSDEEVLQVRNLPIDVGMELEMDAIRYAIVALCVLVPIGIWSRAHWRELQALSRVADSFGQGKLSVRANTKETSGIHPLALCMNRMADRIEDLLDAHRGLLHSVSHELRTPISRLEFGLELLKQSAADGALEARIVSMEEDVRELDALVNELLDLAKLERQEAVPGTCFALAEILRECAGKLRHALADKRFDCQYGDGLGEVVGDPRLLTRAVGNLLLNAAKYAGSRVLLSASRDGASGIEIAVDDDGPGVPVQERERVFDAFYRLDRSRDRTTGGFGLGLAIAQKAARLHGGSIAVTDSPLGGARFVLRLPGNAACRPSDYFTQST